MNSKVFRSLKDETGAIPACSSTSVYWIAPRIPQPPSHPSDLRGMPRLATGGAAAGGEGGSPLCLVGVSF